MTDVPFASKAAPRSLLRNPAADGVLVSLAGIHGVVLLLWPSFLTIGLLLWWNANTVSHYFIHRPFFRVAWLNSGFAVLLSLLLGLPQSVWRDRHLAHHAGIAPRIRQTRQLWRETTVVFGLWLGLIVLAPTLFLSAWLPGLALGLAICAVHGYYEHVDGGTISHHGRLYNFLFFNDGYHVEHHAHPVCDWRSLPRNQGVCTNPQSNSSLSRWPAVLRFLDYQLEAMERLVLRRPRLQRFVLDAHRQAWRQLLPRLSGARRIGIVGGGLFPRTALLLDELLPQANLTIIDVSGDNLDLARKRLGTGMEYCEARFDPRVHSGFDLLVFPLAYRGDDKSALRAQLPAPQVVFHDWIWHEHSHADSVVVSPWLIKRMSLHER